MGKRKDHILMSQFYLFNWHITNEATKKEHNLKYTQIVLSN